MSLTPTIRLARDQDVPALQRFFHEHWQTNHVLSRDRELLRWQYGRPMVGQPSNQLSMLLAEADQAIQGILGFLPVSMSDSSGRSRPGAWLSHWKVLEEHRASGAGLMLLQALRRLGYDAIAVLGINDTVKELYRRLGFIIVEDLPRYLAIVDPVAAQALARACNLQIPDRTLAAHAGDCQTTLPATPCVAPLARLDEQVEPWLAQWNHDHPGTNRTLDYLRWRYQNHPRFTYQHLGAWQDDQLVGLLTWRLETIRDRSERVVRICDLLAAGATAGALARAVLQIASREGACFVDYYSSLPLPESCLRAGFFLPAGGSELCRWPSRLQPLDAGYTWMSGAIWSRDGADRLMTPLTYLSKSDGDVDRPN